LGGEDSFLLTVRILKMSTFRDTFFEDLGDEGGDAAMRILP
jgi:hypothetical protein